MCLNGCHKRPFVLSDLFEFNCWRFSIVVDLFNATAKSDIWYSGENEWNHFTTTLFHPCALCLKCIVCAGIFGHNKWILKSILKDEKKCRYSWSTLVHQCMSFSHDILRDSRVFLHRSSSRKICWSIIYYQMIGKWNIAWKEALS